MSQYVKLFSPSINLTTGRVDAAITFTVNSEHLCTGDGSQTHLKKCLLVALLKEAKEEGGFDEVLTAAGWNFLAEPGIDAPRLYKHYGPEAVPCLKVQEIPSLAEFCKGHVIDLPESKDPV